MSILDRYAVLTLIRATCLILLVLVGFELFILLASQLKDIGKGAYGLGHALMYVLLNLPQETYALFPIAGLLGMLLGWSWLYRSNELLIMRVSGVSSFQLMKHVLQAGFILIFFMTLMGEIIGPVAKFLAVKQKFTLTQTDRALKTTYGLWIRQGESIYHIKTIYSQKHIADIYRYQFKDYQLVSASFAKEAYYKSDDHWQVRDIQESLLPLDRLSPGVVSHARPKALWYLAIDPHLLTLSKKKPDEMSLLQLSDLIAYQKSAFLNGRAERFIFWQRVFQPLVSLILMLFAVPFILGPLKATGASGRLMAGLLTGFVFYLLNQLAPSVSLGFDFSPWAAAGLPGLLFGIVFLFFMRKTLKA